MTDKQYTKSKFEALPAMVCEFLADSTLTYVNQSYCECFGLPESELLGRKFLDFLPEDSVEAVKAAYMALSVETPVQTHLHEVVKDGSVFWHEWTNRALFDEKGQILKFQAVGFDTTDRKMAECLLQARLSLREFSDSHSLEELAVHTLEEAERITRSSASFLKLIEPVKFPINIREWDPESRTLFRTSGAVQFSSFDKKGIWTECLQQRCTVIDNGTEHKSLSEFSGLYSGVRLLATPVIYRGRVYAILGVANKNRNYTQLDIEAIKQLATTAVDAIASKLMETALIKNKERAEAASNVKSEFLANMSHEIRTPLNGVLGMLQLLKTTGLNELQQEYTEYAIQSSKRLNDLLSDILDLTRVEADKLNLTMENFDFRAAISDVRRLFVFSASQKGLELDFFIDPNIPAELIGDATRVQQILGNLVGNAIKFTESGRIKVDIRLKAAEPDGKLEVAFAISDTGIGIPRESIDYLFEPFTQIEGSFRRKFQGAGLGLSICKKLVALYDRSISVESEIGVGSTFSFSLPFSKSETSSSSQSADYRVAHGLGLRVLFVDDEEVIQVATAGILKDMGCSVRVAANGKLALEAVKEEKFDLIFMDIQMPVMDGVEAIKALRNGKAGEQNSNIPVIALTAYAMVGDDQVFLEVGANRYLSKPVLREELEMVLLEIREAYLN